MEQSEQKVRVELAAELAIQAIRFPCHMGGMKLVWGPGLGRQGNETSSERRWGTLASHESQRASQIWINGKLAKGLERTKTK
jgi:hypothetical protein